MSGTFLSAFFAIMFVLALFGLVVWLIRRFAAGRITTSGGRGRVPRLAVIDAAEVDPRRKLVLIRRDNVEHLLMIGGPTDIVVETNIARAAGQSREAPRQSAPDQSWIEPEAPPAEIMPMPEPPPRMPRAPLGADERRGPPMPAPPMPVPPPMPERRPEAMTGFVPESMMRPPQPTRAEPPPMRRAEKPVAPPVAPPLRPSQPPPRAEAPAVAPPVIAAAAMAPSAAEAMSQADKNLAEMAQRLEAALRAPGSAPRAEPPPVMPSKVDRVGAPPVAPEAAPARPAAPAPEVAASEPPPTAAAEDAKPATGFESLEAEMASLLGRPKTPS